MNGSTPASSHRDHPELLVVRLYGDDVSADERQRALDLVESCEECAALLADLGTIADETRSLPVPARPRDFFLTPADAERLRPRRLALPLGFLRWSRPVGRTMLAAGLVGVFFIGAVSALPIGGGASAATAPIAWNGVPARPATIAGGEQATGGADDYAGATPGTQAQTDAPLAGQTARPANPSPAVPAGGEFRPSPPPPDATPPAAPAATPVPRSTEVFSAASPAGPAASSASKGATGGTASTGDGTAASGGERSAQSPNVPGPPPPSGPDPRTLGLLGSGGLAVAGAVLLLLRRLVR